MKYLYFWIFLGDIVSDKFTFYLQLPAEMTSGTRFRKKKINQIADINDYGHTVNHLVSY